MKKILFLSAVLLVTGSLVNAQKIDDVKKEVLTNHLKEAKDHVDQGMSNPKFTAKPEAYLLKAAVYSALANDKTTDKTVARQYRDDGYTAFNKYLELAPTAPDITDPTYSNAAFNLYSGYYNDGVNGYNSKDFMAGFNAFEKTVKLSDFLIEKKQVSIALDTNSILLAGECANQSKQPDIATKYFTRLADKKVGGAGNEFMYHFLITYYIGKDDNANFEKYKAIGKELYPTSDFFNYDKMDFIVGAEEDFSKKIKALAGYVEKDPNNFKANMLLGEVLYDTLNPRGVDAVSPTGPQADEWEGEMLKAFTKANELQPDSLIIPIYLGDHYLNKSKQISDELIAFKKAMNARTKPGAQPSKEDAQKRDEMNKKYEDTYDKSAAAYEKAANLYEKQTNLTHTQKTQYKIIVGNLADYSTYKKDRAKGKPADLAKYEAAEKKWNDLYDVLSK